MLQGYAVLQRDDLSASFEANHSFIVRAGRDGSYIPGTPSATISFEVVGAPGLFLTAPESSYPGHESFGPQYTTGACSDTADDCADRINNAQLNCTSNFAGMFRWAPACHFLTSIACSAYWQLCWL